MAESVDASERLVLQLMQQELEQLKAGQKGKVREDELDDYALALQLQILSISDHIQSQDDREYCLRAFPQTRVQQPAATLPNQSASPTVVVAGPSRPARSLEPAPTVTKQPVSSKVENVAEGQSESSAPSGSNATTSATPADSDENLVCVACDELQNNKTAARAPCGHIYCPDCLACLFGAATTDESLFPPRCCKQPIPLDGTRKWLPDELIAEFEKKTLEFTTANRTYCSNMSCSTFIPSNDIDSDRAYCQACEVWTCTICKSAEHDGLCPDDPTKADILAMAQENGWQQCYGCMRLVEINTGCNHMRCLCGTEFCYSCGKQWHTCKCELWSEDRLIQRADQLVERGMFGGNNNANAAAQAQRHIRRTHECVHGNWKFRSGGAQCEECRDWLPSFIFECRACNILACKRCRHNRL
ncbi:hypothetical protein LLEC1_03458 [Akanthomyces lecanii]|uniref:RBR-type E3 ubiquitin transferase n=1 Tax=Cordyceps confragosa TaxID=2714763 RepID=A0A179IUL0_CORDF|nr:hypothetical protein LLEC1_03458 [Akanthomyces lecanii]